jgi:hypothetical protein
MYVNYQPMQLKVGWFHLCCARKVTARFYSYAEKSSAVNQFGDTRVALSIGRKTKMQRNALSSSPTTMGPALRFCIVESTQKRHVHSRPLINNLLILLMCLSNMKMGFGFTNS